MKRHFHEELRDLKQRLLRMGVLVEEAIKKAIDAVLQRNEDLAEEVFREEKIINRLEIEIDDRGHSFLALEQPMASDLRLLTMILKIDTDLERMGDHAVNIAERALFLAKEPPLKMMEMIYLPEMAEAVQRMLKDALDSFIHEEVCRARNVLERDDEVDALNDNLYLQLGKMMAKDPMIVKTGMNLVMIGHNLERIADLANNIAEDVIYMKEGKEVRHRVEVR